MIKVFQFLSDNGFSFAEAFRQYDYQGYTEMGDQKVDTSGSILALCAERDLPTLFRYLWSDDYVQFWTPDHYSYLYEELSWKNDTSYIPIFDSFCHSSPGLNGFIATNSAKGYSIKSSEQCWGLALVTYTIQRYGDI